MLFRSNEKLSFKVTDNSGKAVRALNGFVQLTKIKFTPIGFESSGSNLVISKAAKPVVNSSKKVVNKKSSSK